LTGVCVGGAREPVGEAAARRARDRDDRPALPGDQHALVLRHGRVEAHAAPRSPDSAMAVIASSSSAALSGLPRTRLYETASTRNSARRSSASCPRFISGTSTFGYRRRTSPVLLGNGFRCWRWARATRTPRLRARRTAAAIGP